LIDLIVKEEAESPPGATAAAVAAAMPAKGGKQPVSSQPPKAIGRPGKNEPVAVQGPLRRFVAFSQTPAALAATPLSVFDRSLATIAGAITTVERQVMDRLFWPSEPRVPTVHPQEPPVLALRARIEAALQAACRPVEELLDVLSALANPILALDPEAIAGALSARFAEAGAFNLAECKAVIVRHRAAAVELMDTLPLTIPLGRFVLVNCADTRAALVKRHRAVRLPTRGLRANASSSVSVLPCPPSHLPPYRLLTPSSSSSSPLHSMHPRR